jgi:phospholipase C
MHPPSDVRDGEAFIKRVYETIRNSRVWMQSALVIVFDEHGGFYDHVSDAERQSAVPPGDGAGDYTYGFRFNRLGVRVPALIISPWVRQNVIDHTTYDHTSILATVERLFGLRPLTNRDAAANDFLELFSQITPRDDAPLTLPEPAWIRTQTQP